MAEWLLETKFSKDSARTNPNFLIICLDSCRYDSFLGAKTPNFSRIGKPKKAYSLAGITAPSVFGIMMNVAQYNVGGKRFLPEFPRMCWLPQEAKKRGYYTAMITPNPQLFVYKTAFSIGFDFFGDMKLKVDYAADTIIDKNIQIFKGVKKPKFVFTLFLATHTPYSNARNKRCNQVKSVEAVDREFGRLLPYLKNTIVVICADHGDVGGRHSPGSVSFNIKGFEVPFIRGKI